MKRLLAVFVVAGLLGLPRAAAAGDVHVAGLVVPPPKGECRLDPKYPTDRVALGKIERMYAGAGDLMGAFADCRELAAWRRHDINHVGHWSVLWRRPLPKGRASVYRNPASYCGSVPPAGPMNAGLLRRLKRAMAANGEVVRHVRGADLGTLSVDATACYFGTLEYGVFAHGMHLTILGVTAVSVSGGVSLWAQVYELTHDPAALAPLLDRTRAWRRSWRREG